MYSLGGVVIIMPCALAALPFIFEKTPANEVLKAFLPDSFINRRWVEIILSSIYWLFHGYCAVFPVIQLLSAAILGFYDSKFMVKPCYQPKIEALQSQNPFDFKIMKNIKRKMQGKTKVDTINAKLPDINTSKTTEKLADTDTVERPKGKIILLKKVIQTTNQFPKALHLYRQVALIFKSFQSFGFVMFPTMIMSAFQINVLCTFVVIKLNDTLPALLVAIMGVVDIAIFVNTVAIYGFAWVITTEVDKFLEFWKSRIIRKDWQLQYATCKRQIIQIGSLFPIHQGITLEHFMQVVDMTTNVLLV